MSKYVSLWPSAFMFLFGLFVLFIIPYQVRTPGHVVFGATFFPYVMGFSIVVLSAVSLITSILKIIKTAAPAEGKTKIEYVKLLKVLLVAAVIFLWIKLMPIIGFIIMTAIAVALHMVIMGVKNIYHIILVSVCTSLLLYYLFIIVLRVVV